MADNILTAPWLQNADLFTLPPQVVTLGAGAWTKILDPNPQRFAFLVMNGTFGGAPLLSPIEYGGGGLFATPQAALPLVVHSAVYPLVIASQWFAYDGGGMDVCIIDILRLSKG